jgi:hypothetical protein
MFSYVANESTAWRANGKALYVVKLPSEFRLYVYVVNSLCLIDKEAICLNVSHPSLHSIVAHNRFNLAYVQIAIMTYLCIVSLLIIASLGTVTFSSAIPAVTSYPTPTNSTSCLSPLVRKEW